MPTIHRRRVLALGAAAALYHPLVGHPLEALPLCAATAASNYEHAIQILSEATQSGRVRAAAIYARTQAGVLSQAFGTASSIDAAFLLGSISKPISVTALMTLYDQRKFGLDDPVRQYIPEFEGSTRSRMTIRHLLTHVSGLPDQLPNNAELRSDHAPLSAFIQGAIRVPVGFEPGTRYEYSSMAILLAAEIAQRLADRDIRELVSERVLKPLGMQHSALGMGTLGQADIMPAQVEFGATESGGGSVESKSWDWNSSFWRELGAPWGGAHASASDIAIFLDAFLKPEGKILQPETAALMIRNHNPDELESRGLGFDVGLQNYCASCSDKTFGHTGSTGTIAWADRENDRLCVVLTTLPARALDAAQHPRQLASDAIASDSQ